MVYENIRFNKNNMAVYNSNFFMIDEYHNVLIQKTAGGTTSFQYPLNINTSFVHYNNLSSITCLQCDGYSFWSLQSFTDSSGVLIRRWVVDNALCNLIKQYPMMNDSYITYDVNTFSVESYHTKLSNTYREGDNVIRIDEFTDIAIFDGSVIGLGPNKYGNKELVTVSGLSGHDILLYDSLSSDYFSGDDVVISTSLFIFNNYNGTDQSSGSLVMVDSNTGYVISSKTSVEFKNIRSSKFSRITDAFFDNADIHTLIFVKGTNAKFMNIDDTRRYVAEVKGSDDFTADDGSLPDTEKWDITSGDPIIFNNCLFFSTAGNGKDEVTSKYNLVQDYSLQVSGTLGGFTVYSGTADKYFDHYLKVNFAYDNNDYSIGIFNSNDYFGSNDYTCVCAKRSDQVSNYVVLSSGTTDFIPDYKFRATRTGEKLYLDYLTVISGVPTMDWYTLYVYNVPTTDSLVSLGLKSSLITMSGSYFDDLYYTKGYLQYKQSSSTYYGIMNMDNLKKDGTTVIPIYDIDLEGDNLYRLQHEAMYYGNDYSWQTYNYQISPVRQFPDFITVDADTHILPATGRNTALITAVSLNQYGDGLVNKPIIFTDDDPTGFITTSIVYTDLFNNTGSARTTYKSGVDLRVATITSTVTSYD